MINDSQIFHIYCHSKYLFIFCNKRLVSVCCPSTPFEVWHCLNSYCDIYSNLDYLFFCCFLFRIPLLYVEYPFETSVSWSNCSESLSSLDETRKMTANIFGHFFLSPLAFVLLFSCCCRPNETKQKEKKQNERRNETQRNEIQIENQI